jgi:hypothetical protein
VAIEVESAVGPKELERALWVTLLRHTPGLRVLPFTLVLCLGVVFTATVATASGTALPGLAYLFAGACGLFAVGVPLGVRGIAGRSARRTFKYSFDDTGFDVGADGRSGRVEWETLYEAVQTRSMIILCEKPSVFHVLPLAEGVGKRSDIDALIDAKVKNKHRTLNVLSFASPGFIMMTLIAAFLIIWNLV